MPLRSANSATSGAVGTTNGSAMAGLKFKQPLSWSAGKAIPIGELTKRLQTLSNEMRGMDQDENLDQTSFVPIAKDLASANLLAHKDRGVRAWTACCLVDVLRLCAPDAPFTGLRLRDIFNMIINSIFPALADPHDAYHQQHLMVLMSLSQFKSIVLVTDIDDADKLLTNLFTIFFDVLSNSSPASKGEFLGQNVELHMATILSTLLDEAAVLPVDVVDVIMAQFLRIDPRIGTSAARKNKKGVQTAVDDKQSTLSMKEAPRSYNAAKTVCNSCTEKMARQVSQYFNDIILEASAAVSGKASMKKRRDSDDLDSSELEMVAAPSEDDLQDLQKAHQLLRELWRACPGVLPNVIPQLEAELSAENVHLRLLATETLGDIVSGIGAAGPPTFLTPDPNTFPYPTLSSQQDSFDGSNVFTKPSSPVSFSQNYPSAYNSFLSRCHDKSPLIRAAWITGICRILATSAGGVRLNAEEEERLVKEIPKLLGDADEKVRVAAVQALSLFNLQDAVTKLGPLGGVDQQGSIFETLTQRVRDRKHNVRADAMHVLARLWGVAVGELLNGDAQVTSVLAGVPSRILDSYMTNDQDIHVLLDYVIFEDLLPLGFPPTKAKGNEPRNGERSRAKASSNGNGIDNEEENDPDTVRTERLLLLVKDLDEKAKRVFYAMQKRQATLAGYMQIFLKRCEDYNGGVSDKDNQEVKAHLSKFIENFSRSFPDPSKFSDHLWKFAKLHDRRAYQLIRFAMAPESDYRTVYKAIKEFRKRIDQSSVTNDILNSMIPLVYRTSALIYNRSHVPAIMDASKQEGSSLRATAHELLRDISDKRPDVLKAQVKEICKSLEEDAPTEKRPNGPGAVDNLKACASLASRFEKELPKDRKFMQALMNFALLGTPAEAAKHAVTVLMAVSDKKDVVARDLVQKCVKGFAYGGKGFLARLATLSQLMLLAPVQTNREADTVSEIAIEKILMQTQSTKYAAPEEYVWEATVDEECEAKCWALKILVNRVRSHGNNDDLSDIAQPVYTVLSKLVTENGELMPKSNTKPSHKPRLRLLAARSYLKLCTTRETDLLLTPAKFNELAVVAQDELLQVRSRFLQRLKKYINFNRLAQRFYTIPFLLAFEPSSTLRADTQRWIRNRANMHAEMRHDQSSGKASVVMESTFARLLSLLAHHPDYMSTSSDLTDFATYILFYLVPVANEDNISLIYHIAQRVKQCRDAIAPSTAIDSNLYHLSDLAQLTIRKFEDVHNWTIQTQPGRASLPKTLFSEIRDHAQAIRIAEKNFLPRDVDEKVEELVKVTVKNARNTAGNRKRKSEAIHVSGDHSKKIKSETQTLPVRKPKSNGSSSTQRKKPPTSKKNTQPRVMKEEGERRRSGRARPANEGALRERDDSEDDEEMLDGVAEWSYGGEASDGEDGEEVDQDAEEEREEVEDSSPSSKRTPQKAAGSSPAMKSPPSRTTAAAAAAGARRGARRGK